MKRIILLLTVIAQTSHLFASLPAYVKPERLKFIHSLNHFVLKAKVYMTAVKIAMAKLYEPKIYQGMRVNIFIVSTALLVFVGVFSACKEKEEDVRKAYSTKVGRVDINETEFVRLYFSPESGFINSPIELVFENNTKGVLTYGNVFSLEYFDKKNWTEIPLDINFEAIGLALGAGETRKGQFNLSLIEEYNNGKKGKYRYVKNFGLYYSSPFEIDSCFNLYAEFEIK